MSQHVYEHFIDPMSKCFDNPPGADATAFFESLAEELTGFDAERLEAGFKAIRGKRAYRTFPTIAECRAACEAAIVARPPASATKLRFREDVPSITREAWVTARRLCRSDVGEVADREGWLPNLIEFCEREGRVPNRSEVIHLRSFVRKNEDLIALTKGGPLFEFVCKLHEARLERARREVFGNAASTREAAE
jgi:hypothetical protein